MGAARTDDAVHLRPLTLQDEAQVLAAHDELEQEGFPFLLGTEPRQGWVDYVGSLDRQQDGADLPEGWVPHTFLVAEVDGVIVGRVSVRHALTEALALTGGHIGYAVRPALRRRGYATAMLRAALEVARSVGVAAALVTCDDDNVPSIRTIERCGGVLHDVVPVPGSAAKRRYWLSTAGGADEPSRLPVVDPHRMHPSR